MRVRDMMVSLRLFGDMVRDITREMMLLMLILTPFLVGLLFKLGVPLLERTILSSFGYPDILVPYYELFSWLLAMLVGMMFAFSGALVILGEIDEGLARYMLVTPLGESGYIASRVVIPAIVSGLLSLVIVPIFSLSPLGIGKVMVMVASTMCSGIITSLLVVSISGNKVEGMAVGKLSGLFGGVFFVPFLIKGRIKYVFSFLPMYHIGEWAKGKEWWRLAVALILFVLWFAILFRRFRRKFR